MKRYLNETEESAVERITAACNETDGTNYTAPLDADAYFLSCHGRRPVAFLAVYSMGDEVDGRPVEELLLFTEPEFRGRHRAGRLLSRYRRMLQTAGEEQPVIRFSAYPSENTESFLKKLSAQHDHDELMMSLTLGSDPPGGGFAGEKAESSSAENPGNASENSRKNRPHGKKLKEQEFVQRNRFSECSVKTYGSVGYIYAVRTDESHLRQGSAEALLRETFDKLFCMGADAAILEVSSANEPAYRLYRKLGFQVTETLQIWNLR